MSAAYLFSSIALLASPQTASICAQDDRIPALAASVGRVSDAQSGSNGFCTITLVSDACAVTAGHCLHVLGEAEFFSAAESADFAGHAGRFVYQVDKTWIRALSTRIGNDWAVVRLKPNPETGLLAGKVHGYLEPELSSSAVSDDGLQMFAVQRSESGGFEILKSEGQTLWLSGSILFHDLDTGAGNSGGLIVDKKSGKAVGINTHGGCDTMKNNKATLIAAQPYLVKAIKECRRAE